jgi:hypothetical protein
VAASVLLIAAHDRPFTGQISIEPEPLLQIMPVDVADELPMTGPKRISQRRNAPFQANRA